jgi:hypothetical protein
MHWRATEIKNWNSKFLILKIIVSQCREGGVIHAVFSLGMQCFHISTSPSLRTLPNPERVLIVTLSPCWRYHLVWEYLFLFQTTGTPLPCIISCISDERDCHSFVFFKQKELIEGRVSP